jgi:hypothetical protein
MQGARDHAVFQGKSRLDKPNDTSCHIKVPKLDFTALKRAFSQRRHARTKYLVQRFKFDRGRDALKQPSPRRCPEQYRWRARRKDGNDHLAKGSCPARTCNPTAVEQRRNNHLLMQRHIRPAAKPDTRDDALKDRDCIQAVILGSAVNNDGAVKIGYTAPSAKGQRAVISEALSAAGASPNSIGYIEAHGTGTPQGASPSISRRSKSFQSF